MTPSFPHCSFKAEHADDMGLMLEYIFLWAVLYYPAGTIPITTVHQQVVIDGAGVGGGLVSNYSTLANGVITHHKDTTVGVSTSVQ